MASKNSKIVIVIMVKIRRDLRPNFLRRYTAIRAERQLTDETIAVK
jgi:hypothetical protein